MPSIRIKKAIITAAGYGTRFLPAVKNIPKEMLPIIDKPIIHYLVDELVASGIEDIIIVTRFGGNAIEDYFDQNRELEAMLEKTGKEDYLKVVRNIPNMANFAYVRQKDNLPYGNGSPILAAESFLDTGESFVYMFGDDLTISKEPVTKQLIKVFEEQNPKGVLAVQEVPWEEIDKYASVEYKKDGKYKYEIIQILEKLPKEKALSNMAQFGRFVLSYDYIEMARNTKTGKDGELWLTDINNEMAKQGVVIAQPIKGLWMTTGDPLRYIKATLRYAMERGNLKTELLEYIKNELI